MNGSIISSKKRTRLLLHSAALDSLTEDLQYKTGLVIVSNNLLRVQNYGSVMSNKKKKNHVRLESAFSHDHKTLRNTIKS